MHRLTVSQHRFWKGHLLHPNVPLYNMAWRFDLRFDLQPDLFRQSLQDTIRNNDILRTVFTDSGDGPMQQVLATAPDDLEIRDLSHETDPETAFSQSLTAWVQEPFDLSRTTMRNQLVRLRRTHWVWTLCQHHIVCDAQSGAVLFDQVSARYLSFVEGGAHEIAPAPDFFETAPLVGTEPNAQTSAPQQPATPPYGSSPRRSSGSARLQVSMSEMMEEALETTIATPAFRLFTPDLSRLALYLTSYFAYLYRVSGDERITIGLPAHNRLSDADRKTLGLFVEVLPFRIDVSPSDTLLALHGKVKTELGAFLRQARPGALAGQPDGDISVICNFIQTRFGDFAGHAASVQWLHSGAHDTAHAIRLHIMDFAGQGQPDLFLDVHDEILNAVPGDDLVKHFTNTLTATLTHPETPISAIDLSAGSQDRAILHGPGEPTDRNQTVLEAFAEQITRTPDATALTGDTGTMSYAQVDTRSQQIAAHIAGLGIAPGSRIAIHLPRSFDFVLAAMGILKSGCSFVPIAANSPRARVEQILTGCNAAAVIVGPDAEDSYPCPSIKLDTAATTPEAPTPTVTRYDTAYVLFTSGSTGVPKGVAVDHGNFARYIRWAAGTFSQNQPANYPFFSSVSFDLTLTSLFVPLTTGGTITVYPERSDPDLAVLDVFAEDKVDVVKLTPSHLALACKQSHHVRRIKTLVLGGENLTSQMCRQAQDKLSPDLRIINEYGPTEAVVGAMHHQFDRTCDTGAAVQIGQPAAGVSISVRDSALNICPHGVTGEIVIGGRLAQGYFNAPDETARKFAKDPDHTTDNLYRTGDLGRINRDGSVEFLGRSDQQIKRGGVRLEVAEYEHALRHVPGVDAVHAGLTNAGHPSPGRQCRRCGLTDNLPDIEFAEPDLCSICADFDGYKTRAQAYFKPETELAPVLAQAAKKRTGDYDAVMLLSGGKDSTYAAYRLADFTSRVLAVTLDNGYISEGAKANIQRVTQDLGWPHRFLRTDKMNQIFVDSLKTHSNVCQGCFKALYTLAFRTALAEGAPMIVTGLSRGQFFETRLTPDLFRNAAPTCAQLDDLVTRARKSYHAEDDALSRLLNTQDLKDGQFLNDVAVLDIYRYIDVPVSEIYDFLRTQTAWVRPDDTGRSTNCLINDVGIHLHKAREGFHNYALPYSWDVRMGHKTRAQALEELNDAIDESKVTRILDEIGFDEPVISPPMLTVYVAGKDLQDRDIWDHLRAHLQREMLPDSVVLMDEMPLTANGKIDTARLPSGSRQVPEQTRYVAPDTGMERRLARILGDTLRRDRVGATQDFFDLGIDSLAAIQIAMRANQDGIPLPPTAVFEHRTLRALAAFAEGLPTQSPSAVEAADDTILIDLDQDDLSAITEALR